MQHLAQRPLPPGAAAPELGGPHPKVVLWAHNSHLGDARATEMGQCRGELNLGQLMRQVCAGVGVVIVVVVAEAVDLLQRLHPSCGQVRGEYPA